MWHTDRQTNKNSYIFDFEASKDEQEVYIIWYVSKKEITGKIRTQWVKNMLILHLGMLLSVYVTYTLLQIHTHTHTHKHSQTHIHTHIHRNTQTQRCIQE